MTLSSLPLSTPKRTINRNECFEGEQSSQREEEQRKAIDSSSETSLCSQSRLLRIFDICRNPHTVAGCVLSFTLVIVLVSRLRFSCLIKNANSESATAGLTSFYLDWHIEWRLIRGMRECAGSHHIKFDSIH